MTFKTQADIQRYLLEEEGRKVVREDADIVLGYDDGRLWDFRNNRAAIYDFKFPEAWQPYQEPRPWYETVEPGTVLCWFWDTDGKPPALGAFKKFDVDRHPFKYVDNFTTGWRNCRPLTPAEIEPFLEAARRIAEANG